MKKNISVVWIFFAIWVLIMTMIQFIFPTSHGITLYCIQIFPFPLLGTYLLHSHFDYLAQDVFSGLLSLLFSFYLYKSLPNIKAQYVFCSFCESLWIAPKFNNRFPSTFYGIFHLYYLFEYIVLTFTFPLICLYFTVHLDFTFFQSKGQAFCFPVCLHCVHYSI